MDMVRHVLEKSGDLSFLIALTRRTRVRVRVAFLCALTVAAYAAPAAAQVYGLPRGTQGLFGTSRGRNGDGQSLNLVMSLSEAYDTDLYGNRIFLVEALDPDNPRVGGYSTVIAGGANYNLPFRRGASVFNASLASELRYYQLISQTQNVSQRINLGLNTPLPGRSALIVNQRIRYSPSFLNSNLPQGPDNGEAGVIDPGTTDEVGVLNLEDQYYYATNFRLTRPVTRRTRVTVRGDLLRSDFVHESPSRRDSVSRMVGGDFGWPLARTTSATIGYRYRKAAVKTTNEISAQGTEEQAVDLGVTFRPRLSASRQAYLTLRVGASQAEIPIRLSTIPVEDRPPDADGLFIRGTRNGMTAGAAFGYPITRGWSARASYDRGLTHVGLVEPLNTDSVNTLLDGMLNRRTRFIAAAGYAHGVSLRRSVVYETYAANVGVNFALNTKLALFADYQYYVYSFSNVAEEATPDILRHSVRAGFALFVPTLD